MVSAMAKTERYERGRKQIAESRNAEGREWEKAEAERLGAVQKESLGTGKESGAEAE